MHRVDAITRNSVVTRPAWFSLWRGDMAADDPLLEEGRVCERCGHGHLEVAHEPADLEYVICDRCHTVWATRRATVCPEGSEPTSIREISSAGMIS